MKMMKKIAALGMAGLMAAAALCGCGGSSAGSYDAAATVATYGETAITAAEASYYIRNTQYSYESMYGSAASGIWEQQINTYQTLADIVSENAMTQIYQTYVLCDQAADMGIELTAEQQDMVTTAAEEFMNGPQTMVTAVGAEQDEIEAILQRNAIAMLVYEATVADVDTVVSDEEARHAAVTVISLPAQSDAYDNAEDMKDTLVSALEAGTSMEDLTTTYEGLTSQQYTIGEGDYENTFGTEAFAMAEGDVSSVYVEGTDTWYVISCDSYMDAEATEAGKTDVIEQRKADMFQVAYDEWKAAAPEFVVDEDVLDTITFDRVMYVDPSSVTTTETAGETAAETE